MTTTRQWYAKRPYIHFDLPLSLEDATAYVSDPAKVTRHSFYPLLKYDLVTPRITKPPQGSPRLFVRQPKSRPIAYPAHKDGYIFSYYKAILEIKYEAWLRTEGLEEAVTAFRSNGENNVTLAKKAFDFIRHNSNCQIVVTDVESFFDRINHRLLKAIWARFLENTQLPDDHYAVYKASTHYSVVDRHKAYNLFGVRLSGRLRRIGSPQRLCSPKQFRDKVIGRGLIRSPSRNGTIGIPQGTSLSPLLSNMYMADLDLEMHRWVTGLGGKYWRYCDDILIVVPGQSGPAILNKLDAQLGLLKLARNKTKTKCLLASELLASRQLQYLGFVFNGRDAVVRSSSIDRYYRKLRKSIRMAKGRQQREGQASLQIAPFRKQALYNMHSDKPVHGKRIWARLQRQSLGVTSLTI